jgi:hypothetical protein
MPLLLPRSGKLILAKRFNAWDSGPMSPASRQRCLNSTVADATRDVITYPPCVDGL